MDSLGLLEQLVLTAVLTLGERAYDIAIYAKVTELADKPVKAGAVSSTLKQLESSGYISSWKADATPETGGRSRLSYKLQSSGKRALAESAATAKRMVDTVQKSLRIEKGRPARYEDALRQCRREIIETTFQRVDGDYKEAAEVLGLHPKGMHRLLRQLKLTHLLK